MKRGLLKWILLLGGPIWIVKSGNAQTNQPLPEFSRIVLDDNVNVELVIADRYSVYMMAGTSEGEPFRVTNQTLRITADQTQGQKVKVYAKQVTYIESSGASRLTSADTLRGEALQFKLNDASRIILPIVANQVTVSLEGGSRLDLSGSAEKLSVSCDDAAHFSGYDLKAKEVNAEAKGASAVKIHVQNKLSAKADDASSIRYNGTPEMKSFILDGLASIKANEGEETFNALTPLAPPAPPAPLGESDRSDTTRVKIGKRKLMIIEDDEASKEYGEEEGKSKHREMKTVWGGFELGVQSFATPSGSLSMPTAQSFLNTNIGSSWFFGLNFGDLDGHIIRNKLALTTGLGLLWNNIHLDGNDYLTPNTNLLTATAPAAGVNLSKNKLYTFDITAPALIKFAPGTKKKANGGFHIATGVILHYVMNKRVVTETSSNGYDERHEYEDDFNINSFRADATVRVGYDRVKLFANYALTPYFNTNKAPDVRLFYAGLTLIGF